MSTFETSFESSDGVALAGDITIPEDVRGAAIVCHPHPQYGGNRFNPVVGALHQAFPEIGVASLRFDFRPDYDDGRGELLDAQAAVAEIRAHVRNVPVFAAGYSFGAMITLGLDDTDVDGKILIAPPLFMSAAPVAPTVETLTLLSSDDQFTPVDRARSLVAGWPLCEVHELQGCDHFLHGGAATGAAEFATTWLAGQLSRGSRRRSRPSPRR